MGDYIALFKRANRDDRYREIGVVQAEDPLSAEQEAVSRLDDGQKRAWFESRVIIKLYNLENKFDDRLDIFFQEDLDSIRDEVDQSWIEKMEEPEGGWPRGSQADQL